MAIIVVRKHTLSLAFAVIYALSTQLGWGDRPTHSSFPIVNGDIAGTIEGKFGVGELGMPSYSMALDIPPGTGGITPKLALNYGSSNSEGIVGPKWSISGFSAITRCPSTYADGGDPDPVDFDDNDQFCLDGQHLTKLSEGNYSLENTKDAAIYRYDTYWAIWFKNGLVTVFGSATDSDPYVRSETQAEPLAWLESYTRDRNGNAYIIKYSQDTVRGETVPERIDYTVNELAGLQAYNSVRFEYATDPAAAPTYTGGSEFSVVRHLRKISMYVGEALAWNYDLLWEQHGERKQERIVGVQRCAADGMCLPETTFTWGQHDSDQLFAGPFFTPILSLAQGFPEDAQAFPLIVGDWNGDGRSDLARAKGLTADLYLSTGEGWNYFDHTMPDFVPDSSDWKKFPLFAGDWNGDGHTDLGRVLATGYAGGAYTIRTWRSSPQGLWYMNLFDAWIIPWGYKDEVYSGDFNGDGLSDIVWPKNHGGQNIWVSTLGDFYWFWDSGIVDNGECIANPSLCFTRLGDFNGDGQTDIARMTPADWEFYGHSPQGAMPFIFDYPTFTPATGYTNELAHPTVVGDWNGDGLSDFGRVGPNEIKLCINTGKTLTNCNTSTQFSPAQGYSDTLLHPIISADWNNDGRYDIARVASDGVIFQIMNGSEFGTALFLPALSPAQGFTGGMPMAVGDFNGDGLPDLARVSSTGIVVYLRTAGSDDVVVAITNGIGSKIEIEYKFLTDPAIYTKGSGAQYPAQDIAPATRAVSRVKYIDSAGHVASTRYVYSGLQNQLGGAGPSGFEHIDETNEQTEILTRNTFRQDGQYRGLLLKTESFRPDGILLSKKENIWQIIDFGDETFTPYIATSTSTSWDLDGASQGSITTTRVYNPVNADLLSEETVRSDGSSEKSIMTYKNDFSILQSRQLQTIEVSKKSTAASLPSLRKVIRTYDTSSYEAGVRGLLLSETIDAGNTSSELTKSFEYDLFGNVTKITTSGSNLTPRSESKIYDIRGQFVIGQINALGHLKKFEYDPRFGSITKITDENGVTTETIYDSFGGETISSKADGSAKRKLVLKANDQSAPSGASYFERIDATDGAAVVVYFDSSEREVRRIETGFNGQDIIVDRVYDSNGNLTQVSDPFYPGERIQWNLSEYDILSRPTTQTAPGDRVSFISYSGFTTTSTNPVGQMVIETRDLRGHLVASTDHYGYTVTYEYNNYGDLTKVTDPLGNVTTLDYNSQGKRILISDPDAGTTVSTYDAIGQLLSETNANGEITTYTYDLIGRPLTKSTPEGTISWRYDTSPHGIGRIDAIFGLNGYTQSFVYDSLSRVVETTERIGDETFKIRNSFDRFGRALSLTYPSGVTTVNRYNTFGYLTAIEDLEKGTAYWTGTEQNSQGQWIGQLLGNGIKIIRSYDEFTGALKKINAKRGSSTVQNLAFEFDAIGNLLQRSDLMVAAKEVFQYDYLNRLTQSHVVTSDILPDSISYDPLGNITSRSDVGQYLYGQNGAGPHAVTSINGPKLNNYSYDTAGNRTGSLDGTVVYNSSGKPLSITKGNAKITFELDPAQKRVRESTYRGAQLVERKTFVGGAYELVEQSGSQRAIHYIHGAAGLVAVLTRELPKTKGVSPSEAQVDTHSVPSSTVDSYAVYQSPERIQDSLRYVLTDHLGSIHTITDEIGTVVERRSYSPWGTERDPVTWSGPCAPLMTRIDRGFTGHEMLTEVGLIHMNGRIYDPTIGRFISPDPFVQSPSDLQSLNRYSYVLNNPLSYTDPNGFFFKKLFKWITKTAKALLKGAPGQLIFAALTNGWSLGQQLFAYAAYNTARAVASGEDIGPALKFGLKSTIYKIVTRGFDNLVVNPVMEKLDLNLAGILSPNAYLGGKPNFSYEQLLGHQIVQEGTRSVLRGIGSTLVGGRFIDGASMSVFGGTLGIFRDTFVLQTVKPYTLGQAGWSSTWKRGESVWNDPEKAWQHLKNGADVLYPRLNNIGLILTGKIADHTTIEWDQELGTFSQIANLFPGANSTANFHDLLVGVFTYEDSPMLTQIISKGTIPPAILMEYMILNGSQGPPQ